MHETVQNSVNKMPPEAHQSDGETSKPDVGGHSAYHYPFTYNSVGAEGKDKSDHPADYWHYPDKTLAEILMELDGPIIEIAGPTEIGFYFLDGKELPSRPIISNILPDTQKGLPKASMDKVNQLTELLIDGRHMDQIPNSSCGMFLSAHLNIVDEAGLNNDETINNIDKVKSLMERDTKDGNVSPELMKESLRLQVAQEVFRKLKPGGLYMTDGGSEEILAFKLLGFETVGLHQRNGSDDDGAYFDIVLQKPVDAKTTDALNYDVESTQDGWDSPQRAQNLIEKYIGEGSVILDIGIGTGQAVKGYAEKGASIIGLDNDPKMLSIAQNVTGSTGEMRQADINKPLPINNLESQVDVVQAVGVIEFVNDFDTFVQQVKTALRPGGVFVFTIEELDEGSHKIEHFPSANVTIHRHSNDEIHTVLRGHGLSIVYEEAYDGYIRDNSPVPYRIFLAKN